MILYIVFAVSLVLNVVAALALLRAVLRMFQFDDLFDMLVEEIDVSIAYFDKLLTTPLLIHSPEIVEANRNMKIIRQRMNEFVLRMEDVSGRKFRTPKPKNVNPPVVA